MHTQAIEDYLREIYALQERDERATTSALAARLDVAAASVTNMFKKLAALKLVLHEPYKGVTLTPAGLKAALEVVRHHRLIELYLSEALGVPWDQVHEEAEKWEHVLSEDVEDRIDAALGHPTTSPHGAPIPARDGTVADRPYRSLDELDPGQIAEVTEVSDRDPALLRYLGELGLYPHVQLEIVSNSPYRGTVLRINGVERTLGRDAARHIFVKSVSDIPGE